MMAESETKSLPEVLRYYAEFLDGHEERREPQSSRLMRKAAEHIEKLETLLAKASTFDVLHDPRSRGLREVRVERCGQRDGSTLWAVRSLGSCLAKDGEWEYESLPSNRTDEFYERCRYATMELAFEAAEKKIAADTVD